MITLTETRKLALAKIAAAPAPTTADIAACAASRECSKRAGGELRGNSTDRRNRTAYLLAEFGDGENCLCVFCGVRMGARSLTQDRIVSGSHGGRYRHANLLPACMRDNAARELSGLSITDFMNTTESREGQMI
jgi:hypothetical protein